MRQAQWTRTAGERSWEDGEAEAFEGLGWAERAALRRDARAVTIPKAEAFRYRLRRGAGGRIVAKTEVIGVAKRQWEYAYDPQGKLVSARLDGQVVERYAYDSRGRRTHAVCRAFGPLPVRSVYDAGDRLLAMGDVRFAYDEEGRLASRTEHGQTTFYEYDGSGLLARVTLPGGGRLAYVRGEGGLPLRKELDGRIVEEFTWRDGLRPASWRDVSGKRLLEFHYEGGRRVPGAMTVYEGGYSYTCTLGADQVGTVKTVEDSTGCLIKELQYDSFGNVLEDSAPRFFLPLGFAGGLLDRHTGLVRFGLRDYMPGAGRFTAPDPARWTGGDPDLYDYCVDDPIGKVDPLGLEPEDIDKDGNKLGINENGEYWTVKVGSDKACDRCKEMAKNKYAHEPKRPHPNCKCEYTKHKIDITWVFNGSILSHVGGRSWAAVSGPHNNGPLPSGVYKIEFIKDKSMVKNKQPFCDPEGNCWSCLLTPLFDTKRWGLAIHPDGNVPGTSGCIGISPIHTSTDDLRNLLANSRGQYLRVK